MSSRIGIKKKGSRLPLYLIISVIAGFVAWILGEFFFEGLTEKIFTPLGILLYFLFLFVILFVVLTVLLIKKLYSVDFKRKVRMSWKLFLIVLLVFLLITGLFEFLYELGKEVLPEPTSLIFLIDDSGSMAGNEADRIKALNDVMKDNDLPFAVYSFTGSALRLRDMDVYRSELDENDLVFDSDGGTEIISSINDVLKELEYGNIKNAGSSPKILLVSDGGSSSFGLRAMAKNCKKQMVTVSSIGMKGSSEKLLKSIAESTGGVYVSCTDISALGSDLTKAVATNADRNLLSERVVYSNDGLYVVLRILFLSIMGFLWSILKYMLTSEEKKYSKRFFIVSVLLCVLGAFVMEFGSAVGIPVAFLRLIFDVLWMITLGTLPKKTVAIETTRGNEPSPSITVGKMNVDRITDESTSSAGLKQISGRFDSGERADENGNFGANNNSGGLLSSVDGARKNSGSGLFGNGTGSGNNSGLFGSKTDNGNSDGLFGN